MNFKKTFLAMILVSMNLSSLSHADPMISGGKGQDCNTKRILCKARPGEDRRILQCYSNVANNSETSSCSWEIVGCSVSISCNTVDADGNTVSSFQDSCD